MVRASALVAIVALCAFTFVYSRKRRPDWVLATGMGLVFVNTFSVGIVGAARLPWAAIVLGAQVVATTAMLISMRREWRQWVADGRP